jgi:hypothetical protein
VPRICLDEQYFCCTTSPTCRAGVAEAHGSGPLYKDFVPHYSRLAQDLDSLGFIPNLPPSALPLPYQPDAPNNAQRPTVSTGRTERRFFPKYPSAPCTRSPSQACTHVPSIPRPIITPGGANQVPNHSHTYRVHARLNTSQARNDYRAKQHKHKPVLLLVSYAGFHASYIIVIVIIEPLPSG